MYEIDIIPNQLYKGCLLAAIIHAVAVSEYHEFNYEHSWDGVNYCMNNSQGCRGTITFDSEYIIAVFRDESQVDMDKDGMNLLDGIPDPILAVAKQETLQYVLDDMFGEVRPVITAAFWGDWETLYSSQSWEEILCNGANILHNQLLDDISAFQAWDDEYGLNNQQMELVQSLLQKKLENKDQLIKLSKDEMKCLYGDIDECRESLQELGIFLDI